MAEEKQSSSWLAPIGIVWLISLVGGLSGAGSGHGKGTVAERKTVQLQQAETKDPAETGKNASRLWDDPLTAADALTYVPEKCDTDRQAGDAKPEEEAANTDDIGHLIFVLTKGLRYPDMAEWRRQQRYAVQAALWTKGYQPSEADYLKHRDIPFRRLFGDGENTAAGKPGGHSCLRVPFEDFKYLQKGGSNVRVCYINTELVADKLLASLCRLADLLAPRDAKVSVTSPTTTDWLKTMMTEGEPAQSRAFSAVQRYDENRTMHVFNTLASGDIDQFPNTRTDENGKEGTLPVATKKTVSVTLSAAQSVDVTIHQLIENDSRSTELIMWELAARGRPPGHDDWLWGSPCKVALVSEGETGFGRAFAQSFMAASKRRMSAQDKGGDQSLLSFHYLRGISGAAPGGRASREFIDAPTDGQRAAEAKTPGEALSRSIEPPPMPPPFGENQFDYIARLGEDIARQDRYLRASGQGQIETVLLIGTDVDDKLALLKVLRPRFPSALFITNEMDAEYLQPENSAYTRNLIIFTRYGLDRPKVQGNAAGDSSALWQRDRGSYAELPSFRRSFQLGMVDCIHAALEQDDPEFAPRHARPVELYEAGMRRWHRLQTPAEPGCETEHGGSPSRAALLVAAGASVFALLALLRQMLRRNGKAVGGGILQRVRKFLCETVVNRCLLGASVREVGAERYRQLLGGEGKPLPAPKPRGDTPDAEMGALFWLVTILLPLIGIGWWCMGWAFAISIMFLCSALAMGWFFLRPDAAQQKRICCAGICIVLLLVLTRLVLRNTPEEESFAELLGFADGVSVWPAVLLRALMIVISFWALRKSWAILCALSDKLTKRFFLELEGGKPGGVRHAAAKKPAEKDCDGTGMVPRDFPRAKDLDQGSNPDAAAAAPDRCETEAWQEYLRESDPSTPHFSLRWMRMTVAAIALTAGAMLLTGFPQGNTRTAVDKTMDMLTLAGALLCLSMLCAFVADQIRHCHKFVERIHAEATTALGFEMEEILQLIGRLTAGVGELLVYPFMVCFILMCAHSGFFAQWFGLTGLYAMLAIALGFLVVMTWRMQKTAQSLKGRSIKSLELQLAEAVWMKRLLLQNVNFTDNLQPADAKSWWSYTVTRLSRRLTMPESPRTVTKMDELLKAETDKLPKDHPAVAAGVAVINEDNLILARQNDIAFSEARIARIGKLIELVRGIRDGAFGKLHENPIVKSILIPSAGLGSLELIRRLMTG